MMHARSTNLLVVRVISQSENNFYDVIRLGSKLLRWDTIGGFWTFPAKTMWQTRRLQHNSECNWSVWWSPNHGKGTETWMVWPHLKILWHGEDSSAGALKGARRRERQKKKWEDNIKEWTQMEFGDSLRAAENREGWKGIVATSSVVLRRPPRLRDWDETRLKIIESLYFPKEMVKIGLKKSNQNGRELKAKKLQWISSAEISNLDVHRDFSR